MLLYVTSQIIHWFVMSRFRGDVVQEGESRNRPWNPPPPQHPRQTKFSVRPQKNFSIHTHIYIYECCKTVCDDFFGCPFILVISRCHSKFLIFISQLVKMVVQNCSQYTTCEECKGANDTYCGWCSLANK